MENINGLIHKPPETEKARKTFDNREKAEKEKYEKEYQLNIDTEGKYLSNILLNTDTHIETYSETLVLNPDGSIDSTEFVNNGGNSLFERAKALKSDEGNFYQFLNTIIEKYPNLELAVLRGQNEITFTFESKIKKGAFIQWISQGAEQFTEPKPIVHIESGKYVFVDGTMTGIPVSEIQVITQ
jgi:hypothetical protein